MRGLLLTLTVLATMIAVLVCPAALLLDRTAGADYTIVNAVDAETVEVNRVLWSEGEPVAEIYGIPSTEPERLLFANESNVLHPEEDPSLNLYLKRGDDHPLQAQLVWFIASRAAVGALVAAIAGFVLLRRMKRGEGAPEDPQTG
ncbi:MAG: hypothetical protein ACYTDX_04380 [Planctomycetota bacterium]